MRQFPPPLLSRATASLPQHSNFTFHRTVVPFWQVLHPFLVPVGKVVKRDGCFLQNRHVFHQLLQPHQTSRLETGQRAEPAREKVILQEKNSLKTGFQHLTSALQYRLFCSVSVLAVSDPCRGCNPNPPDQTQVEHVVFKEKIHPGKTMLFWNLCTYRVFVHNARPAEVSTPFSFLDQHCRRKEAVQTQKPTCQCPGTSPSSTLQCWSPRSAESVRRWTQ